MNTKYLMIASALFMGILGGTLSFLPQEAALYLNMPPDDLVHSALQVMGAMYVAFAMMNWTGKANLIGGIYSRPVAVANAIHFMAGAIYCLQTSFLDSIALLILSIGYSLFAILFVVVLFRHPIKES